MKIFVLYSIEKLDAFIKLNINNLMDNYILSNQIERTLIIV